MPLTRDRDTIERNGELVVAPAAANVNLFFGALACADANGRATPGAVATTLTALGRVEEACDNTGGAAGARLVTIKRGTFLFRNHGADAVTQADLYKDCWIVDDETVARTNGTNTRSRAGKVLGVESGGVWVEIR